MHTEQWEAAKNGDKIAARNIVNELVTTKHLATIKLQTNGNFAAFLTVPSSTGKNMLPVALAEKLAIINGGKVIIAEEFIRKKSKSPMKDIPILERPFIEVNFEINNVEELKKITKNYPIIIVEDVLTTGASVYAFIRNLRKNNIKTHTIMALMGDPRITP